MDNDNDQKIYKIQPQLLFLYNSEAKIIRSIFLTIGPLDEESWVFGIYKLLIDKQSSLFLNKDYEVINDHLFLTYNIKYLKGYINNLLNLQNIILFSLTQNIEFYYDDNKIFNPFNETEELGLKSRNDDEYLYQFYQNASSNLIINIVQQDINSQYNIIKNGGSEGIYCKELGQYTHQITNNILNNSYALGVTNNVISSYNTDIPIYLLYKLLQDDDYYIEYNKLEGDNLIVTGSMNYIPDNEDLMIMVYKCKEKHNNNDVDPIFYYDKVINIIDINLWKEIPEEYLENINIKGKQEIFKSIVSFNTKLNFILNIDLNFNFIIKPTEKTKNIYTDISNKINIITSINHINFRSKIDYKGIPEYLTVIILGYSHINNKRLDLNKNVKINNIYISRYCQNSKGNMRKPIVTNDDLNLENYIKLSSNFYQGKEITKEILNDNGVLETKKIKLSDIYITEDGIYNKCVEDDSHIGFLDNMYHRNKLCIPCCYQQSKTKSNIFKKCVYNDSQVIQSKKHIVSSKVSPFVKINKTKKLKIIFQDDQLGDLGDYFNNIFNTKGKIEYLNTRITTANNYIMYKKYNYGNDINNDSELMLFFEHYFETQQRRAIVIQNESFFIDKIDNDYDKYDIFLLINKKIHILVSINKLEAKDSITYTYIRKDIIENIINIYKKEFNDLIIDYKGKYKIQYNYNTLYVNDRIFDYEKISYFIKFKYNVDIDELLTYNINDIKTEDIETYNLIRQINKANS